MIYLTFNDEFVKRDRGSGTVTRRCTVYRIKRNVISQVATREYQFESTWQAFMGTCEANKLMPRKAFERHPMGGYKYGIRDELREAGIATVMQL